MEKHQDSCGNMVNNSEHLKLYNRYVGDKYPLAVFGLGGGNGLALPGTACPDTRYGVRSYMIMQHPSVTGGNLLAHEIGHVNVS